MAAFSAGVGGGGGGGVALRADRRARHGDPDDGARGQGAVGDARVARRLERRVERVAGARRARDDGVADGRDDARLELLGAVR